MNRTGLAVLALVTVVVIAAVVWLGTARDRPPAAPNAAPLVPGLGERVNRIDAVDVIAGGAEAPIRLRRERDRWRVLEKDSYEADFEIVHGLLRALAEGRRAEPRTTNPEHFLRLGVADLDDPGADGRQLEFPGTDLPALIVGHTDPTAAGRFVRLAGDTQVWLSDRPVDIPGEALDWLERSVMDIPSEDIAEVVIRHADGDTVELRSTGPGSGEFVLTNAPDRREAGPAWIRASVARGLSGLRLEDVRRHHPPLPEDAVRVLFTTDDGLHFVATLFEDELGRWAHFTVSPETEATAGEEESAEPDSRLIDAVTVDARLSPWEFRIRDQRYRDLTRRLEDFLETPEGS